VRYRNPVVGVAVVLRDGAGRVLMGRRATGPYAGLWCIPCGYVEWEEDVRDAASREILEETGLEVELGEVVAVHSNFHNPKLHTVGIWFAGSILAGEPLPVDGEFTELAYVDPSTPPDLAFPTDRLVLEQLARRAGAKDYISLIDYYTTPKANIAPLFADGTALRAAAADIAQQFADSQIDAVAALDAFGFVLGTAVAAALSCGVIAVRKPGKLPAAVLSEPFLYKSGETSALEVLADAIAPGMRLLVVDEWIETGVQAWAACRLLERAGGVVAGVAALNIDENDSTAELRARYHCVGLADGRSQSASRSRDQKGHA
jgi:adenine phosphoribosyltransferase